MQCTLLVPDLFWPEGQTAAEAVRDLDARPLEWMLGRAQVTRHAAIEREAWLCQAFEVERQQDWPVAPLTLALDGGDPGDGYWLRADPAHLQLQRERVALVDSSQLAIEMHEAQALVAALNRHFAGDGLQFDACAARRWYVRVPRRPAITTRALSAAAGRDVHSALPQGDDAAAWRQVMNEAQMILHAQPANDTRAEAGVPAINSIWLWGGGIAPSVPGRAFSAVWSDDALALALGVRADAHTGPLPRNADAWRTAAAAAAHASQHLLVIDACTQAARYGDVPGWRDAVSHFTRDWIAPLLELIRAGSVDRLVVAAPCAAAAWRFELTPGALRKFWRRARGLPYYSAP